MIEGGFFLSYMSLVVFGKLEGASEFCIVLSAKICNFTGNKVKRYDIVVVTVDKEQMNNEMDNKRDICFTKESRSV